MFCSLNHDYQNFISISTSTTLVLALATHFDFTSFSFLFLGCYFFTARVFLDEILYTATTIPFIPIQLDS